MLVFNSETLGLQPPRLAVFGEGRLRSPEKERWEGAPERLMLAFYQSENVLENSWHFRTKAEKSLHKPIQEV